MDRFTLGIVGGVLALIIAALVAAASLHRAAPPDLDTPSGVVLAYTLAEQRGDAPAAWELLASSVQARADRDRFLAWAGRSSSTDHYCTTDDERLDANGASVVLVCTAPASGGLFSHPSSSRTTVRLIHESAGWRISVPPDDYLLDRARS
jgi:hypothetical protein